MASSRKTALLGLNQWNLEDKPRMSDFNNDNYWVDQFLKGHLESALHITPQQGAWLAEPAITGAYAGDGKAARTVDLGFRPALLFVFAQNYGPIEIDTATSTPQLRFAVGAGGFGSTGLALGDTGFAVTQAQTTPPAGMSKTCLNQTGVTYRYFAMK